MLSEQQAAARATRVGASEVAALLDAHPYVSPLDIYARLKWGETPSVNQPMRVGALLELPVLRLAEKLEGLRARSCVRAYVHPTLPLSASPDAYSWPHRGYPRGLVEVKVTYAWADLPGYVYWQAMTQLLLTHRPVNWVVALAGSRLGVYPVEADRAAFDQIEAAVADFDQRYLAPGIPPPSPVPPSHVFNAPKGQTDD